MNARKGFATALRFIAEVRERFPEHPIASSDLKGLEKLKPMLETSGNNSRRDSTLTPYGRGSHSQSSATTSSPRNIPVINKGTTTVSITGITLAGPNPGDFAEITNCGNTLAAGAHRVIQITFTPTTTGSRTAQVAVSDNGGGSPQTAALIGTGTP